VPASSFNPLERRFAASAAGLQTAASVVPSVAAEASEISTVSPASMPAGISIPTGMRRQAGQSKNGNIDSRKRQAEASDAKRADYQKFRAICDEIIAEIEQLETYFQGDELDSDAAPYILEIEDALERLYSCHWGENDSLKMVVVALQSQLNNAQWDRRHVTLLRNRVAGLRKAYLIDDQFVNECYQEIDELGLNEFRGTLSEGELRKRYRIVEEMRPE
jgi:hypothetical protein